MTEITLKGIAVQFPFKPYQVQEDYMSKVIECLQDGKNEVLESPTGTGKTLSLLCSSLAWLTVKKAQIQVQVQSMGALDQLSGGSEFVDQFARNLDRGGGKALVQTQNTFGWSMPKIIYASRTHSQLSQAMQELKRSAYKHVNVTVLGSRDQLCIHPEVAKETNSATKIHMCQAKIKSRTCYFHNNVEARKDDPNIRQNILDIEDLVKTGQKLKCCPYYLTRELKQSADIIFMPYNYILDPKTRKAQGIEIQNNVVLLDEAHNVEKMCEEATSLQISSTDIAVCIDEITAVMKDMANETSEQNDFDTPNSVQKDFTAEDLCNLKAMFLEVEKAIDAIVISRSDEGETFPGGYIFELLEKADISHGKSQLIADKLDKIILYLSTVNQNSFMRKGNALQKFCDLLRVVFAGGASQNYREKVKKCYKVYVQTEQPKKASKNNLWEKKKITKSDGKLISYWCFSPGFGMQQMLDQGVRSVILTSGTLSPLKPFISEIGIDIGVQLENPHIVTEKQICVGIISAGFDGHTLNSSYNTRNDPKYIASLGETIKILSSILPHGLLIFFPSYPIMRTCQDEWQKAGKWTQIETRKPIFVEPQSKDGFNSIINEYYNKINDPQHKGAIFMAVCRGKVSEGLDFANANGRAVMITGLPFPPLKDPRVILKQRYLDENRASGKDSLTGQQWYQLEASRAVNQAIGRIIRHKNDYGAILLCDCRFDNPSFKQQLSAWIRPHIKKFPNFKSVMKDLQSFFKYAQMNLPQPAGGNYVASDISLPAVPAQFDTSGVRSRSASSKAYESKSQNLDENFDINSLYKNESYVPKSSSQNASFASLLEAKPKTAINFSTCKPQKLASSNFLSNPTNSDEPSAKRRKVKIAPVNFHLDEPAIPSSSTLTSTPALFNQASSSQAVDSGASKKEQAAQYVKEVKNSLPKETFKTFKTIVSEYQATESNVAELLVKLEKIFIEDYKLKHLLIGFKTFLKPDHLKPFDEHVQFMQNSNVW